MKLLKFLLSMMIVLSCFSCQNSSDEEGVAGDIDFSIIGKWKLVKSEHPWGGQTIDYSKHSIVYEFRKDNILKVSGEPADIGRFYCGETGESSYSIIEPNKENSFRTLKIGNNGYCWHKVSAKELILDESPLDGGKIYFIRIN